MPPRSRTGFATRTTACQRLRMEQQGKSRQAEAAASARSFVIAQTSIAARPLEPALYLVATPIGNLSDITIRALETLAAADIVACEDTRVTRVLLDRYGIRQRSTPYHEHNADEAGPRLIAALERRQERRAGLGCRNAAGVRPRLSPGRTRPCRRHQGGADPRRIRRARGADRIGTALGYLPVRRLPAGRRAASCAAGSKRSKSTDATLIFFESPRRLAETLDAMAAIFGSERRAVVARELTKTFEELRRGTLDDACRALPRGCRRRRARSSFASRRLWRKTRRRPKTSTGCCFH